MRHSTQEGLPSSFALNPTNVPPLQAFDLHVSIPGVRITSRENNSFLVCWRKSLLLSSLSRQVELILWQASVEGGDQCHLFGKCCKLHSVWNLSNVQWSGSRSQILSAEPRGATEEEEGGLGLKIGYCFPL